MPRATSLADLGLIPAHAGKTGRAGYAPWSRRAHPRSRGENTGRVPFQVILMGSSPLTRGKHGQGPVPGHTHGLIPAHAGKTVPIEASVACTWAHPRSRGENELSGVPRFPARGSSPLTRGKHCRCYYARAFLRLIPAHAGKTT